MELVFPLKRKGHLLASGGWKIKLRCQPSMLAERAAMKTPLLDGIDFIDFGTSAGHSLGWAQRTFQKIGLGIDLDPRKIEKAVAMGYRAVEADATNLQFPDEAVEFAIISDFLEHLRTEANACKVVENAVRVARDFVYIALPDFDNEQKLNELGFKRYYADWSGHNLHLRSSALSRMVSALGHPYDVFKFEEIFDSYDRSILPRSAPRNSSFYEPELHGPKAFTKFPRKLLFTRVLCLVVKSRRYASNELLATILSSIGYLRHVDSASSRIPFSS